ncbi:metallophosphoesterase family protein [Candidatus Fermentibacterales bacterium]|nr:metallophosphoesterase family protein [Candidatus Fermentibacterales bacterium]
MLIRVISDIHANLEALEAVLAHGTGEKADITVCLGDIVGYGASPVECLDLVRGAAGIVLMGNHDAGACGITSLEWFNDMGAKAIEWQRPLLREAGELEYLSGLELSSSRFEGLFLCHSYPPDPGSWHYVMHAHDAIRTHRAMPGLVCLVGHTHLPCAWSPEGSASFSDTGSLDSDATCIINCGSVGQPRDGDPRAAYLLLDMDRKSFRHVRVAYDVESAASRILGAGLPRVLATRLFDGR